MDQRQGAAFDRAGAGAGAGAWAGRLLDSDSTRDRSRTPALPHDATRGLAPWRPPPSRLPAPSCWRIRGSRAQTLTRVTWTYFDVYLSDTPQKSDWATGGGLTMPLVANHVQISRPNALSCFGPLVYSPVSVVVKLLSRALLRSNGRGSGSGSGSDTTAREMGACLHAEQPELPEASAGFYEGAQTQDPGPRTQVAAGAGGGGRQVGGTRNFGAIKPWKPRASRKALAKKLPQMTFEK